MTADVNITNNIKLLPLPEKLDFFLDGTGRQEAYNLTRDYARACVEANTEALRERLDSLPHAHLRKAQPAPKPSAPVAQLDRASPS